MASRELTEKYLPKDNAFYKARYHQVIYVAMCVLALLLVLIALVTFQVVSRPLPSYQAIQPEGSQKYLQPYLRPNLLPGTILSWASKAATSAYTFDFANYPAQLNMAKPYFTDAGWVAFNSSIQGLIAEITARQLFVYGVVSGTPVISNEGPLPGFEYVWQVQIPFLVTYLAGESSRQSRFVVRMNVVKVPTTENPQGIGIDQFVMQKVI